MVFMEKFKPVHNTVKIGSLIWITNHICWTTPTLALASFPTLRSLNFPIPFTRLCMHVCAHLQKGPLLLPSTSPSQWLPSCLDNGKNPTFCLVFANLSACSPVNFCYSQFGFDPTTITFILNCPCRFSAATSDFGHPLLARYREYITMYW